MKKCTSCAKDLPDTAMHCVFCGAKQAAAPVQANPQAKTVLGYSAAELLKQAGIQPGGAPPPGGGGYPPPQQGGYPPPGGGGYPPPGGGGYPPPQQGGFPPPGGGGFSPPPQQGGFPPPGGGGYPPQQFQPPPQAAPPPQQFQPPPQPAPYQPPGGGGFQPPGGFPPPAQGGQFGGSASTAATMFMQNAPQIQAQPAQQPPPSYQPPQQFQPQQPAPQPYQPPGAGGYSPSPYQPPGGGGFTPAQQPYNPVPVGGQPPYLASQTAARQNKPVEPFNDVTKLAMLIFGGCLLAYFLVPITLSPLILMVQGVADAPGKMKLLPLLIGAGGILGVLLAVMPLQPLQRGMFAALVGLVPILLFATVVFGFAWQSLVFPIGGILVPSGLLLRDAYPTDKLPRLFVFIGAACIAVPFFVPFRVLDMFLDILKSLVHPALLLALLGGFVPLLLSAVAVILCLIPGQFKFGAKQIAWAWFVFPALLMIAQLTVDGTIVDALTKAPGMLFSWAGPPFISADKTANASFALPLYTGFAAMATFGVCTLFGKQLEQSK